MNVKRICSIAVVSFVFAGVSGSSLFAGSADENVFQAALTNTISDLVRIRRIGQLSQDLIALIDAISEHHIDPPTRQQMILDSLRKAAAINNRHLPSNLAVEISATPPEDLNAFLTSRLAALSAPAVTSTKAVADNPNRPFPMWVLTNVQPIQISMTPPDADRIQKQLAANRYVGIGIRLGMHKTDGPFMQQVILLGAITRGAGFCRETVAAKNLSVLLQMPVSRLRRAGGQSLTSSVLPRQRTMQVVPVAAFEDKTRPGNPVRLSQSNRHNGPGVRPDFTDMTWPRFDRDDKPELELTAVLSRVLEVLDADNQKTATSSEM